jgi:hypothetical protein
MFAGLLGMGGGGWGAGLVYDQFDNYQPAFAIGMALNLLNLAVVPFLVTRERDLGPRAAAA